MFLFKELLDIKNDNTRKIALAVELLHNASLIHDDILDNDTIRRNIKTLNAKFNTKTAVLAGDLLLSSALNILSNANQEITDIFAKRIFKTIEGELKQNQNNGKITSIDNYFEKTFNKTANLFFAGLESLFTLKEIKEDTKNHLVSYLTNFCFAFQIQNDINDIEKDFNNKNYTLPLIFYFEENEKFDKSNLEKYILKTKDIVQDYKTKAIKAISFIDNKKIEPLAELIKII